METNKDFNDFLDEAIESSEDTSSEQEEITTETSEDVKEETVTEEQEETATEEQEETEEVEKVEEVSKEEPTTDFKAFAELRVKAKNEEKARVEAEEKLNAVENFAKSKGFDSSEAMFKYNAEKELEKEAEERNIPLDVLKRLNDLEQNEAKRKQEAAQQEQDTLNQKVLGSMETFKTDNKLSDDKFKEILKKVGEDEIDFETLKVMPQKSIVRLLNSYVDKEVGKQKELEKQVIKSKATPLTPVDKNEGDYKEIEEDMFKVFSGQKSDF